MKRDVIIEREFATIIDANEPTKGITTVWAYETVIPYFFFYGKNAARVK